MRNEEAFFKCDICGKEESVSAPLIRYGPGDTYPGWFFDRKLKYNDRLIGNVDVCEECFQETGKEKAVRLIKRFFNRVLP